MAQEIQSYITNIYDQLYTTNGELTGIRYLLLNTIIGHNDNFLFYVSKIEKQKQAVSKILTQLAEHVVDLEYYINQCKHVVSIEAKKDKQLLKKYNKYFNQNKHSICEDSIWQC